MSEEKVPKIKRFETQMYGWPTKGLIIIGYQGIGKSSIAGKYNCIDLESGNFWVDGQRADDWYAPYCEMAMDLANQGYVVLTSSHKVVYEYLAKAIRPENIGNIIIFCPPRTLKNEWIQRLKERYERTRTVKDYKALKNAEDRFDKNIMELCSCGLPVIQPSAMDYDLRDYVYYARHKWCVPDRKDAIQEKLKEDKNGL